MALFRRNREFEDLEAQLREQRPQAPEDLVTRLSAQASPDVPRRSSARVRYGLAAGFAATFVVAAAALGGSALFTTSSPTSERVVVSVPAKAVPTIRALQAKGAILAAAPIQLKQGSFKVSGVKGVVLDPVSADVGKATGTSSTEAGAGSSALVGPVRSIAPVLGAGAAVTRLPASTVYLPGVWIVICYPLTGPPNPTYITTFVPLSNVGAFVPPGTYGPCPTV